MHITNDMIARDVMGWQQSKYGTVYVDLATGKDTPFVAEQVLPHEVVFNPLADYNHCRLVEERIKELGLRENYLDHLLEIVGCTDVSVFNGAIEDTWITSSGPHDGEVWREHGYHVLWYLTHATAAQRCEAAYRAWKEWNDAQSQ